jgi:hypothetical protein
MRSEAENNFDHDDEGVSRLVGGLPRVDAPANFDRRVMTKIAEGETAPQRFFGLPVALAYATPLLLVLVIGVAVFISTRKPETAGPIVVATNTQHTQAVEQQRIEAPLPPEQKNIVTSDPSGPPSTAVAVTSGRSTAPKQIRPTKATGGSSADYALSNKATLLPQGISPNPNRTTANKEDVQSPMSVSAKEALTMLGISADYQNGWKVLSVGENSAAGHSGVKAGDVVIALGQTELAPDTVFRSKTEASSIRVKRDGSELTLPIKR